MKRNQRALRVLRQLRQRQEKQNQKIDILCRDIVSAHSHFVFQTSRLQFVCQLYESLLAAADTQDALDRLTVCIRQTLPQATAAVFLLEPNGFDIHLAKAAEGVEPVEKDHFQLWFSRQLVGLISQTNRVLWANDLLEMGLCIPPATLKNISLAAVPLGELGQSTGFILIYSPAESPLGADPISHIAAAASGIRAVCQRLKPATAAAVKT